MTTKATVHVVDDDHGTLNYLSDLLSTVNYNTKTYHTAHEFLEQYKEDGLGCLVLDLRLPGISGLELQQQLADHHIDLPVIMISGFGDVPTAVKALKAGVLDFIEKPFRGQDLLDRIQLAISKHKLDRKKNASINEARKLVDSLTRREREVMDLVVKGNLNKDIATQLGISIKTVEVHRSNVMDKMGVNSVTDLVRLSMLSNNEQADNPN